MGEPKAGVEPGDAGEVSEGPSSFSDAETSLGGADAVPGTPDATPSTKGGDPAGENVVDPKTD